MKKIVVNVLVVFSVVMMVSCSDHHLRTTEEFFEKITTTNVQYNGWRNMIVGGQYVFSPDGLGTNGIGKINVDTNRVSEVCLQPNCLHGFPGYIDTYPNYCRASTISELLFVVDREIFYIYHVFEVNEEKKGNMEEGNSDVIWIFASYNYVSGEHRDILKIKTNEFEQMYKFIHSNGYIYYSRNIAKTNSPQGKEDYQLSCCRMKLGEYEEEVLFAFQDVCFLPEGVLPDPIATEDNMIYFTCVENGRLLEVDMVSKRSRFFLGDDSVPFGTFDSPGAFYVNGYIYFTAVSPDLVGSEAEMFVVELHRLNCKTGETQKLTNDLIRWFFVSDNHIYYGMDHSIQPTKEQIEEAGDDLSVHVVKRIDHDGKNVRSYKMTLSSPHISLMDVVGMGDSLYFRAGYYEGYENLASNSFKVVFNVKTQETIEIGKGASASSNKKPL